MQMVREVLEYLGRWDKRRWKTSNFPKLPMAQKINRQVHPSFILAIRKNRRRVSLHLAKRPSWVH
jgi:hypothetical protein